MTHYERISDLVRMIDIDWDDPDATVKHLINISKTSLAWAEEIVKSLEAERGLVS
jgi:hypothetical protein